jgi:hypothetical protein
MASINMELEHYKYEQGVAKAQEKILKAKSVKQLTNLLNKDKPQQPFYHEALSKLVKQHILQQITPIEITEYAYLEKRKNHAAGSEDYKILDEGQKKIKSKLYIFSESLILTNTSCDAARKNENKELDTNTVMQSFDKTVRKLVDDTKTATDYRTTVDLMYHILPELEKVQENKSPGFLDTVRELGKKTGELAQKAGQNALKTVLSYSDKFFQSAKENQGDKNIGYSAVPVKENPSKDFDITKYVNEPNKKFDIANKMGYIQGVCECVGIVSGVDQNMGKKLLTEMNVTKDMAKKYANPETYKTLENGIFAQKQEQHLEQTQGMRR